MPDIDATQFMSWPPRGGQLNSLVVELPPPLESIKGIVGRAAGYVDDLGMSGARPLGAVPTAANIWRHHGAHPLVLVLMILDAYGEDALEWHPDVLKTTLQRDGRAISNAVWNKIMAGRVILTSPSPWRQWHVFHWVTLALCGGTPNFIYLEKPEVGHLVAGYDVMRVVDPDRVTGYDVDKFIAACFIDRGDPFAPEPLGFVNRELNPKKLHCSNCGSKHRDDNDTRCIRCSSKDLTSAGSPWQSVHDECATLWESLHRLPLVDAIGKLPETPAGTAVHRLLVDWDYARDTRVRLLQQLKVIGSHA